MKKKYYLLILLVALGTFLRFYRLSDWLYFNMDEERDAFVVKRIIVNRHFTLIGGSVPGGIYVGPGLYYLSSLPMLISKLNPVGLGITASCLGVFSIWLIFKVGEKLFNDRVGLIAAALFSSSYLMVIYNRHFWPLTPAPVVALLTIYSLYQIIKKNKLQYCYLLSLALVVGLQSDPSNATLLILTLFVWWFYRLPIKKKPVILSALIVVFSHLPLVMFDLRHNFLNSKALIKLLSFRGPKTSTIDFEGFLKIANLFPRTLSRLIYTFGDLDISKQLSPCLKYQNQRIESIPKALYIASFLILIYWFFKGLKLARKNKNNIGLNIISFHIGISFLCIVLFYLVMPSYIREYFLSVLFPGFILLLALTFEKLRQKGFAVLIIPMVAVLMFFNAVAVLKAGNFLGFSNKMEAVKFALEETKSKSFVLESLSSCFRYNGSRYLFYLAGKEPDKSFMDSYYTWLYDKKPIEKKPQLKAVFVSLDEGETDEFRRKYLDYQQNIITAKKIGGLEVLVVKNEEKN